MPGTRSGEYAHLAVSPDGSGPDMEREGGRVCVRAREAWRARPDRLLPELASPVPPLPSPSLAPPPSLPRAQPSSAGSRGKLLIALRQPGTGNPE